MTSKVPLGTTPNDEEPEYLGAPTELADREEMPSWVALLAEVVSFAPFLILLAVFLAACLILFSCVSLGGLGGTG